MPDSEEIDNVLNECMEAEDTGRSKFPGMNYEQGVKAAIEWLRGDGSNPMDDAIPVGSFVTLKQAIAALEYFAGAMEQ